MLQNTEITDGITTGVEVRKQRGMQIAAVCKIAKREDGLWAVPSQSCGKKYRVCPTHHRCTCPDFETRGCKCKHQWAVEFVLMREQNADGTETITKSVTVTETIKRPTYGQNWTAYNTAQTTEKSHFQILLRDLCSTIEEPPQGKGRPRIPLKDAIFSAAFKVFSTFSGRRFISDLCDARAKGYISRVPHFNSIFNTLESPELTPILKNLIAQSARPLAAVETTFAIDSTGFGSSRFAKWYSFKYEEERIAKDWVKIHLVCGTKTNIVSSVEVSGRFQHDSPFMPGLVKATAQNFTVKEMAADKGYVGKDNMQAVVDVGGIPYIPFKTTSVPEYNTHLRRDDPHCLWNKMFHYFNFQRDEFLKHYHLRSNVESTFMSIKAKFGDALRSKTDVAQTNEALCKVLCHNVCCLIQSIHELKISPVFGLVA